MQQKNLFEDGSLSRPAAAAQVDGLDLTPHRLILPRGTFT